MLLAALQEPIETVRVGVVNPGGIDLHVVAIRYQQRRGQQAQASVQPGGDGVAARGLPANYSAL